MKKYLIKRIKIFNNRTRVTKIRIWKKNKNKLIKRWIDILRKERFKNKKQYKNRMIINKNLKWIIVGKNKKRRRKINNLDLIWVVDIVHYFNLIQIHKTKQKIIILRLK